MKSVGRPIIQKSFDFKKEKCLFLIRLLIQWINLRLLSDWTFIVFLIVKFEWIWPLKFLRNIVYPIFGVLECCKIGSSIELYWRNYHFEMFLDLIIIIIRVLRNLVSFKESEAGHHWRFIAVVNFINILRAPFLPIFWCQKLQSWNVTRESFTKHFRTKIESAKCWWNWLQGSEHSVRVKLDFAHFRVVYHKI